MIRACPNAVPHKKGKRDKKKSGKSAGNRLSERILLFAAITAATTGRTAVRRLVQRESHICRAAGGSRTAVHKLQLLVRHKADIHFGDIPHRAVFRLLHTRTAERHVKCRAGSASPCRRWQGSPESLPQEPLFTCFTSPFVIGAVLLNTGGEDINIHRSARFGFLTEIIQHGRAFIAHDSTTLKAFYKYIHKNKV